MKLEVKVPRHTDLNTAKGKENKRESLLLFLHLAWPRDGLCGTWNWGASICTCRHAQNGAKSLLSQRDKRTSGNAQAALNTKAQRPRAAASRVDRPHRPSIWHTRGSGTVPHDQPKVDDQRLTSPREPKLASTRIQESCHILYASKKSQP